MSVRTRPSLPLSVLLVAAGTLLGVLITGRPAMRLNAAGGDRPDAAVVATGPISVEQNPALKVQIASDAVYYLNYSRGFLYAAVPMPTTSTNQSRLLSDFGERDLLRDFQIGAGSNPHFTMTTGSLGSMNEGWAPLYVFETTTGQMVAYRVIAQARVGNSAPTIQIVDRRSDPRLARARTTPGTTAQR
jgi:hypothetical protein